MPLYLDTRGQSTLGIGICGRCSRKMPLGELHPDPNAPGLRVCREDLDQLDPYRLAPRAPDPLVLRDPRPDVGLYRGPTLYPVDRIQAAIQVNSEERVWQQAISDGNALSPEAIEADPLAALAAGDSESFTVPVGGATMGVEDGTDDGVAAAAEVTQANVSSAWQANRYYPLNSQVTPINPVGEDSVGLTIYVFTCIVPGLSGATAPTWTDFTGTVVLDNNAVWINAGLYLP